jgi:putative hydrolase of the HAD superfamily
MAAQPNPASGAAPRAVLLDAMGTLLHFAPPAPLLRAELRERLGADPGANAAEAAIRAEIAYYRAHLDEGRDAVSLSDLRHRCAEAMRPALPPPAAGAPGDVLTAALLGALRFAAYPDAAPALRRLRGAGVRLVVVSNWDASLHERLAETGLAALVDGAVASAQVGSAKPDTVIFARALELAGAPASATWHVGDSIEADVAGARAAGLEPVLLDRHGAGAAPAGVAVIATLAELPALAQYPPGARR